MDKQIEGICAYAAYMAVDWRNRALGAGLCALMMWTAPAWFGPQDPESFAAFMQLGAAGAIFSCAHALSQSMAARRDGSGMVKKALSDPQAKAKAYSASMERLGKALAPSIALWGLGEAASAEKSRELSEKAAMGVLEIKLSDLEESMRKCGMEIYRDGARGV